MCFLCWHCQTKMSQELHLGGQTFEWGATPPPWTSLRTATADYVYKNLWAEGGAKNVTTGDKFSHIFTYMYWRRCSQLYKRNALTWHEIHSPQLSQKSWYRIYYCFQQWKNFKNRLTFDEVTAKIRHHVVRVIVYLLTRCSAIAERPRCRVRYSFRQK